MSIQATDRTPIKESNMDRKIVVWAIVNMALVGFVFVLHLIGG
jgi:hypothetical protein